MSARVPRKVFAAPFVVTLAACGGGDAPPREPVVDVPTPTATATVPPPEVTASASAAVAPPVAPERRWTLTQTAPGECTTMLIADCAAPPHMPREACDPSPAMKYECPKDLDLKDPGTIIRAAGESTCMLHRPPTHPDSSGMHCPKGMRCNPPRPQSFEPVAVACPGP